MVENSTSCKSLVSLLIISPLRWSLKKPTGSSSILLNISVLISLMILFRIGVNIYNEQYRKMFFKTMAMTTILQIMASALIFPSEVSVISSNEAYSVLVSTPKLKLDFLKPPWSWSPNIKVRKGVSIAREISEKIAERMFRLKYPKTSFGYFFMYEKIIRKLFISEQNPVFY